MAHDRIFYMDAWILFFILLVGTGFRLAVISQTTYVAASGYSSCMKSTLNYASANQKIVKGNGEWRDSRELFNEKVAEFPVACHGDECVPLGGCKGERSVPLSR